MRALLEGLTQVEASRRAGYQGNGDVLATTGARLARRPRIAAELLRRRAILDMKSNMSRETRLAMLEQIALDPTVRTRDQLKALELRAKMAGDLVERRQVEQSGPNGGPVVHEVTGKDGAPLAPTFVPVTMAERRARIAAELAAIEETERDLKELLANAATDAAKPEDALAEEGSETP